MIGAPAAVDKICMSLAHTDADVDTTLRGVRRGAPADRKAWLTLCGVALLTWDGPGVHFM
jgi:hypothetical protein